MWKDGNRGVGSPRCRQCTWLTGINDINNCRIQAGDNLADAFSMRMTYQTADYTETPQYNGNIASLSWRAPLGTCRDIQGYHFTYDAANRLKAASFWERTTGAPTINDKYSEPLINYDLNGNITQYQRRGLTTGTTYDQIDLMVYTYDAANPDRLYRIADLAPSANRPYGFKPKGVPSYYGYDNAGNMTSDGHKDLTMAYNALNLPDVFTFANVTPNNKIEIVYNAAGEKLEKQVYTGATLSTHKRYVMGIEYTGANLEAIYHAEGRIVPIGGGVFRYEYTLKDHLGNSRVMFAANGTAIQLLQENHFYPFGMEMKGAWITQSGTENGYQYNGKELNEDWGLNWSDYGARWYDASVGRWNAVDFLAESYQSVSPYAYVANNPITFIDPDGMRSSSIFLGNGQDEEDNKKKNQSTTTDILRFITGALHNSETTVDHLDVNTNTESNDGDRGKKVVDRGATFFSDETRAYNFMWNNSYKKERALKDNVEYFAWIVKTGVIVLPTEGVDKSGKKVKNNFNSSQWYLLPYKIDKNGTSVQFDGKWYRTLAHIHTHPTSGEEDHSGADRVMINQLKTTGFIIAHHGIYWMIPNKNQPYKHWLTPQDFLAGKKPGSKIIPLINQFIEYAKKN